MASSEKRNAYKWLIDYAALSAFGTFELTARGMGKTRPYRQL